MANDITGSDARCPKCKIGRLQPELLNGKLFFICCCGYGKDKYFAELDKIKKKEDIPKIHKLTEFFKYGFCIALVIWMCGICFSTFYNGSAVIRVSVIVVSLCIYIFFVIGKAVVESKSGK